MRDRGQMILVGGILLAVLFVALALLVNTAIYTDNVATRGGDSAGEALEYQSGVVSSIGGLMDAENAHGGHTDVSNITQAVEDGTVHIDTAVQQNHLRRGAAASVSVQSDLDNRTNGLLIREAGASEFHSWEANATGVRGFTFELDPDNMTAEEPLTIDLDRTSLQVNYTGGDVAVENSSGDTVCSVDGGDTVHFDVTGKSLDGEPCQFESPEFGEDSEIAFENGSNAGGSYELTVAEESKDNVTGPEVSDALYSLNAVEIRFDSPEVSYETTVRIAPGEPDA